MARPSIVTTMAARSCGHDPVPCRHEEAECSGIGARIYSLKAVHIRGSWEAEHACRFVGAQQKLQYYGIAKLSVSVSTNLIHTFGARKIEAAIREAGND